MAKNAIWELFKKRQLLRHNNLPIFRRTLGHFGEGRLHDLPRESKQKWLENFF
jgi:hypothetical protein